MGEAWWPAGRRHRGDPGSPAPTQVVGEGAVPRSARWRVARRGRACPAEAETRGADRSLCCADSGWSWSDPSRRGCYAVGHPGGSGGDGTVFRKRVAPERARTPLPGLLGGESRSRAWSRSAAWPTEPPGGSLRGSVPSACESRRKPRAPQCDRRSEGRKRAFNYLQNIAIWLESITPELVSFLSP